MIRVFFLTAFILSSCFAFSQSEQPKTPAKSDFQIYLKQPARSIKLLMYERSFLPIQGKLSEDRKSIIMKDYEHGNKVHVKVQYEDGTEEEFTKSPCYIDPVIV
jgi:hypothetical protein